MAKLARMSDRATELPGGIVVFVFTDIEGSTRLFRRLGDGYVQTLERHNELLRRAWSNHRGHEVKTEGDGFFVAFEDAGDAIRGCIDAQRALSAEAWPDGVELRSRMGIHAGLAYPRDDDYVSLAVHQTARVESSAHGGQVLISEHAAALADDLDDVSLEPVGVYRVRDFDEPVRLYQVHADGIEDAFPAVRAVPADRHNLTRPATSFVGRDDEVAGLGALLSPGRLVTVVGAGGVGKTRLVTELGLASATSWPDGVWLVDLSPIEDPARIPDAIAGAVGAVLRADLAPRSAIIDHLRERQALLILDTTEHLVGGVVRLVTDLLDHCPRLGVLATSRTPLSAPGEQLWRLGPLETGDDPRAPAVTLFAERASAMDPAFRLDEQTAPLVGAICRRVDGLPLAIELAAARVGVLSLAEIRDGLEDRFRILRSRDSAIPERQRTLDGLLDWSERLLAPDERAMLRRLGVFAGDFGLAEAGAVAPASVDADEVPELVWTLAESSLVTAERSSGFTRYRLLGSVQAFAQRALQRDGSLVPTAGQLGSWYVARFFEEGRFRRDRIGGYETSVDNIRGVLQLIADEAPETAQWLACGLGDLHVLRTRFRSGAEELRDIVDRITEPTQARVYLLVVYADLLLWSGEPERATEILDAAEGLRARVGSPTEGTDWSIAYDRADLARRAGDQKAAIEMAREALDAEVGDAGRSRMLNLLGVTQYELGDIEAAYATFEEGLRVDTRLGHEQNVAIAHANLAETTLILERYGDAAGHALACLRRSSELGMSATVGMALAAAGHLAAAADLATGVRLAVRSVALHESTGFEAAAPERGPTIEGLFDEARARLGDHAFERAREDARTMPLPDAIALADRVLSDLSA